MVFQYFRSDDRNAANLPLAVDVSVHPLCTVVARPSGAVRHCSSNLLIYNFVCGARPEFFDSLCTFSDDCLARLMDVGCLQRSVSCTLASLSGPIIAAVVSIVIIAIIVAIVAVILAKRGVLKAQTKAVSVSLHGTKFERLVKQIQAFDSIWVPSSMLEILGNGRNTSILESSNPSSHVLGAGASGRILLGRLKFARQDDSVGGKYNKGSEVLVALKEHYDVIGMNADANFAKADTDFQTEVCCPVCDRASSSSCERLGVAQVSILRRVRHPNIVSFVGLYQKSLDATDALSKSTLSAQGVYIVMEYAKNGTVAQHLRRPFSDVSLKERSRWMIQVARAMDYLHQNKIVHRDLKPSNILLDASMKCLVTDFGISCFAEKGGSNLGPGARLPGTMEFMPPEAFSLDSSELESVDESVPKRTSQANSTLSAEELEAERRAALQRRMRQSVEDRTKFDQSQSVSSSRRRGSSADSEEHSEPLLDLAMPGAPTVNYDCCARPSHCTCLASQSPCACHHRTSAAGNEQSHNIRHKEVSSEPPLQVGCVFVRHVFLLSLQSRTTIRVIRRRPEPTAGYVTHPATASIRVCVFDGWVACRSVYRKGIASRSSRRHIRCDAAIATADVERECVGPPRFWGHS